MSANKRTRTERCDPKNATSQLLRSWRKRGYADLMAGLPFDPEYDRVGPNRQLNYENGRLMAADALAARAAR